MTTTTVLAPPLASDSQSQGLMEVKQVTVTALLDTCQDKVATPASMFVITIVLASNGGQGLQRVRRELSTWHRSAWSLETRCWGASICLTSLLSEQGGVLLRSP